MKMHCSVFESQAVYAQVFLQKQNLKEDIDCSSQTTQFLFPAVYLQELCLVVSRQ